MRRGGARVRRGHIREEEDWSGSQEEETSAWADNDYLDYSETFREVELSEASGSRLLIF